MEMRHAQTALLAKHSSPPRSTVGLGRCSDVWLVDDFTPCFENDYLRTILPLILCGLSLSGLLYSGLRRYTLSNHKHAYSALDYWRALPSSSDDLHPPISDDRRRPDGEDSESDDEFGRNAELALQPTVSQANRTTYLEADKPRGEILLVCIESLVVLTQFVLALIVLSQDVESRFAAAAAAATSTYTLLLVAVRLFCTISKRFSFPFVWYHTAFLYNFLWILSALVFRSSIIHPKSRLSQTLTAASFALSTVLALIALCSRAGNKPVDIEFEADIPPAQEITASLLSYATFSWVDQIVWVGYQKTLEMTDVWNLPLQDKAATVLAHYRQIRKTSSLAWHLLKYFRSGILAQAAWACCSGLLTFVPTLLLREILRYIEDPRETPRNTAWFFVILLFASGAASALADGQALWIGRHLCIRSRAVIIGEIYAKALRRKAGSNAEKVLGEEAAAESRNKWFWLGLDKIFKKKAKKTNQASDNDQRKAEQKKLEGEESQVTAGTVINLMAVDSFKISEVSAYLHFLWASTPVQLIMSIVLLYQTLGFSSIAGIGTMIFLLPVNMYISSKFASIQKKILAATDARIHTTNEILTNIRIIKFFAWEQRFIASIDEKRKVELKNLRTRYIVWAAAATIWGGAPVLITFLSFAVYTFGEGKDLIPSVAFTALSLFQILRIPLDQLADMVAHVQEAKVSVDRVAEFLAEEDTQKYIQLRHNDSNVSRPKIGFVDGTFTWGSKSSEMKDMPTAFRLMDLNLKFEPEQLNIIAGPTGSGKTSLLMALLGEMTLLSGSVHLPGGTSREDLSRDPDTGLTEGVAYCAQQAWLVNGTVKDNIIFASPWNAARYKDVIRACALTKDLEILDKGDATLVGEKGVTLSGGQKQRISLARALYCNARHVLLDDILSAVDSHTAKWIFDEALMGPLMYNRTCILVTHNIGLCLPHCQYAVLLENGKVAAQGDAASVINSGRLSQDLTKSLPASKAPSRAPSASPSEDHISHPPSHVLDGGPADVSNRGVNGNGAPDKLATPAAGPAKATLTPSSQALEEGKAEGGVKLSIILMYLQNMGGWGFWTMAATIFVAQQVSNVSTNVWIQQWANAYSSKHYNAAMLPRTNAGSLVVNGLTSCSSGRLCTPNLPLFGWANYNSSAFGVHRSDEDSVDAGYYLGVYAILGIVYMAITFIREGVLFAGSLTASKIIHTKLVTSVSRAKFRFFDSTPLGQIMNRFSKDIENVDQEIAPVAVGVIHCMASIVTIVLLISVITPGFLIAGFFISILYFFIGFFYINSSRDLKRLESVQRSPLYQQFGETLTGMTTIRAYGDERRFIRDNLKQVNTHNRPFIYLWAANRWLAFRVDIAGALVSFFTGVFVVLSVGKINAGAAGLALTYAVTFTENVLWFVRLYAMNEQNMNSIERVKEYLDLEQEAPAIMPEKRPTADWPTQGVVEFVGYSTRYRPDFDLVLRGLTFKIAPCEKIGVVGRTGAGKSSLALALFRALEAEEGKILIDDIDISHIGLQDLRENIVMVPQDPTLFSGTIRNNLDPFGLFTDEEIFTSLRRVQLIRDAPIKPPSQGSSRGDTPQLQVNGEEAGENSRPTSSSSTGENKNIFLDLSTPVAESGSNLSQGQRQLLCLARALLKEPKILLMDEATASIDYATDSKVQETIRQLKGNTIITIAHRLKTVVDYDRVMVMDHGRVVEIGSPWGLLRQDEKAVGGEGGRRWFREMCETSGDLAELEQEAEKNYNDRRLVDDE